jgi:hypothetical protein
MILDTTPEGAPDLNAAFIDGSLKLFRELKRGDEEVAHVGDLSGMCDRLAHARRSGFHLVEPDHASVTNMSMGLHLEEYLMPRLEAGLIDQGFTLERNLVVVLRAYDNGEVIGLLYSKEEFERFKEQGNWDPACMVKGHLDAVIRKGDFIAVIDTKTKAWRKKFNDAGGYFYPDSTFRDSHLVQIGSYGLAFPEAKYGAIFEFNKAGCESRTGWFELEGVYPIVKQRFFEVLERTHPVLPPPEARPLAWTEVRPGESWACGYLAPVRTGANRGKQVVKKAYCEYTACPNHISQQVKKIKDTGGGLIGGEIVE